jgi:serine/threonine protein phosphatase PrpC
MCLQDAWCVQERLGGQDMLLFGVFDGHGQEGKVVSHTICQNLPKIMARMVGSKVSAAEVTIYVCWKMALHASLLADEYGTRCLAQ